MKSAVSTQSQATPSPLLRDVVRNPPLHGALANFPPVHGGTKGGKVKITMTENETIKLQFNGHDVTAPSGVSILRAAELNDIYIPTLCYHKDLSPFGGCRMCLVEIEGQRGYPLACSTLVSDGMKILTDTVAIKDMRREILALILSEHPASCLICGESTECKQSMKTVRKAGVSTGCRYCPNDGQCELQEVVERIGIEDIEYPVLYHGYEAERYDPFFDRDYNICILCGRCVRMCQEMRGTGVLAFNWRGPKAIVGTAFGRNHIEAGCEFCGACISVCPTGALAEKASKWDGIPDSSVIATCPYCAIGCQLEMWQKNGKFSKAHPVLDPLVNDGQACLKGRFCLGEVSHHFERARKPMMRVGSYWKEITWDEAIETASEKLKEVKPGEFAMLVSPDLTNENLYTAQKFARLALGTNSIDSTARLTLGDGVDFWTTLFSNPISIQSISKSDSILVIGLDTRFDFSIIGVEIRKALQKGAKLITINSRESNLARYADIWLRTFPGMEGIILKALVECDADSIKQACGLYEQCGILSSEIEEAATFLKNKEKLTVIVGPRILRYTSDNFLFDALISLAKSKNINIIPLYYGANTRGAIELGAFAEILPGPATVDDKKALGKIAEIWGTKPPSDKGYTVTDIINGKAHLKVLYLVGAAPFFERPDCDFIIAQDIFEPDFKVDLFLPAASFLESSGTLTNLEGRVQRLPRIEELPDSVMYGRARPDWWIFSKLAQKLGSQGFGYKSSDDVLLEISSIIKGFPKPDAINRNARTMSRLGKTGKPGLKKELVTQAHGEFVLVRQPGGYSHRGVDIRSKVEGLQILNPEDGFNIHPDDALKLGINDGDTITVKSDSISGSASVKLHPEIPRGAIYLYIPLSPGGLSRLKNLSSLFNLPCNPCPVEVIKNAI